MDRADLVKNLRAWAKHPAEIAPGVNGLIVSEYMISAADLLAAAEDAAAAERARLLEAIRAKAWVLHNGSTVIYLADVENVCGAPVEAPAPGLLETARRLRDALYAVISRSSEASFCTAVDDAKALLASPEVRALEGK